MQVRGFYKSVYYMTEKITSLRLTENRQINLLFVQINARAFVILSVIINE